MKTTPPAWPGGRTFHACAAWSAGAFAATAPAATAAHATAAAKRARMRRRFTRTLSARFEGDREAYVRRRTFVGRWTCSFPSRRRCSRCASPPSSCAATDRAMVPSSSPGRGRSRPSRSAQRRSRGAPLPAGTTAPFASTTCSAGC